jgi:hypothetical protein
MFVERLLVDCIRRSGNLSDCGFLPGRATANCNQGLSCGLKNCSKEDVCCNSFLSDHNLHRFLIDNLFMQPRRYFTMRARKLVQWIHLGCGGISEK